MPAIREDMNAKLAALPIDPKRQLPIPHSQVVNEDGTANFAAIDGQKAIHASEHQLCGLCGQTMGYWVAFIGGPKSVQVGAFVDPPMHPECAEDATRLCPHMARQRVPRRDDVGADVVTPPHFQEDKPDRWAIYITRQWQTKFEPSSRTYLFLPKPAKSVRWFHYVDDRLVEQGAPA